MLAVRRAARLKIMGHHKECSEHCAQYLEGFDQQIRFDKTYATSMARTSTPCSLLLGWRSRGAENVYSYVDDSLDSSGTMVDRKQLVLGATNIDQGLPIEGEKILTECTVELRRGTGQDHFLFWVWYQLLALCYISLRRLAETEDTVLKNLIGRLGMLDEGKIEFRFFDYELRH